MTCTRRTARATGPLRVVALDYGIKATMVRQLAARFTVTVVPAATTAAEIRALEPDGVFLSNGPGDPAALSAPRETIAALLGDVPIFGICLGQQVLAEALGASTYKLAFGHHGSNHPVRHLATGRVEMTAQNHNYAVRRDTLGDARVTHVNLNDGVVEGFCVPEARGVLRAVPPRGRARAPRRAVPVRRVRRAAATGRGLEGL